MEERKKLINFPLGNGLTNNETDVRNIKSELAKRNFYNRPVENGFIDQPLTQAIKDFQRGKGLKVDGLINPDGETENALINSIDPSRGQNLDSLRRDQIINNKNDFKFKVIDGFTYPDNKIWENVKYQFQLNKNRMPRIDMFEEVSKNSQLIERKSKEHGVDPDLAKSIAYLETAHGYYDRLRGSSNSSIRPMNVNPSLWGGLGYSREDLDDPEKNIEAGVRIIRGIQDRLTDNDIKKIATLYNGLGQTDVSLYGKRTQELYNEKPWKRR